MPVRLDMVKQLVCVLACSVTVVNPHGILIVRTDDGQAFTAEWGSAQQLTRSGFVAGMLTVGDRVREWTRTGVVTAR